MKSHFIFPLCLLAIGCGEKRVVESPPEEAEKILVGEIAESVLAEMRYKRITDGNGGTVQGGGDFPHEALKLDAQIYKPLAVQWAGIKSLDPIPGHGTDTFFRYKIIAELYPDAVSAMERDAEFDATYRKHIVERHDSVAKTLLPVTHFAQGRVFYLMTTDMAASWDDTETGKIRFALMRQLTE